MRTETCKADHMHAPTCIPKQQHTPTYRICDRGESCPLRYLIQESFGPREIDWVTVLETSKRERAELVVRAVNGHEENRKKMLLAADALEILQKRNETLLEAAKSYLEMASQKNEEVLRVAIAQAEGGK